MWRFFWRGHQRPDLAGIAHPPAVAAREAFFIEGKRISIHKVPACLRLSGARRMEDGRAIACRHAAKSEVLKGGRGHDRYLLPGGHRAWGGIVAFAKPAI